MTSVERHNYRTAVIVSIAFHGILLLIVFFKSMEPKPVTLETYPVGMVEVSQISGGFRAHPAVITGTRARTSGDSGKNSSKHETRPNQPKKSQPRKTSSEMPLQNHPVKEGTSGGKSQLTKSSEEPAVTEPQKEATQAIMGTPGNNGGNDTKTPTVDQPISFGSGEGMVSQLGPPPYPKNAVNEGKEGEVAVRILVHANGNLDKVLLLTSSGDSRLDKTTINFITRDWRFKPAARDYFIELTFIFHLKSGVAIKFIQSKTGQ